MSDEKVVDAGLSAWSTSPPSAAEVQRRTDEEGGRAPRYWCRSVRDAAVVELFVHVGGFTGNHDIILWRDVDSPKVDRLTPEMMDTCLWAPCRPPTSVLDHESNSELESKYKLVTKQLASEQNRIRQLERTILALIIERHELKQQSAEAIIKWCDENKDGLVKKLGQSLPGDLRDDGWAVAVHNDYKQDGHPHTFWLLTRDGRAVKGEGPTDAHALNQIRNALGGEK